VFFVSFVVQKRFGERPQELCSLDRMTAGISTSSDSAAMVDTPDRIPVRLAATGTRTPSSSRPAFEHEYENEYDRELAPTMTFQELTILLPCHSLEDFPLHHEGEDAAGLLAAWTALWHPALIASAGKMPGWARADDPPSELAGRLLIVPQVSESILLAGWTQRAAGEGATVIRKTSDRQQIIEQALAALDNVPAIDPELTRDFLALGYAYLQEELLTRQMRYISHLDEVHFNRQVTAAAQAAAGGQGDSAREHLKNCFDVLTESREHVYPAEAYLVDLTLVASTTIGASLRQELAGAATSSLLISADTLRQMAANEPESLTALRGALEGAAITLVGGELGERELPLLPQEAVLEGFAEGGRAYRQLLGRMPQVYGRRRYGLSPLLPQVLSRLGFSGALHVTLDEGQFPRAEQAKASWEGLDGTTIEALSRVPLDVDQPASFLGLCQKIGQTMDMDHVATVVFAHWPGKSSTWYDDLRRIARQAPVLGRFVTLDEYFKSTASSGITSRFRPDQYRSPYLRQAIIRRQANPLSSIVEAHERSLAETSRSGLAAMAAAMRWQVAAQLSGSSARGAELAQETAVDTDLEAAARSFTAELPREGAAVQDACLVLNPLSFPRRALVDVGQLPQPPDPQGAVKAAQEAPRKLAIVDVPAMGYAWAAAGAALRGPSKEPPMAEPRERMIRNECFEVYIDEHTGAIRSVRDFRHRGNRLSQQLALRQAGPKPKPGDTWRDPDETAIYSVMAADSVEITSSGPALGEIVSRGRLLDQAGKRLAGYQQTVQVWRGSRIIGLEIELAIDQEPRADPWNSYYAARFAWPVDDADLYRAVGLTRQKTELRQIESPLLVEVVAEKMRLAVLSGGLPYHRRVEMRMLDTMLVVRGETRRKFRLGIAVDHPQPVQAAVEWLSPVVAVREKAALPRGGPSGSVFQVDSPNVIATHWSPLAGTAPGGEPVAEGFAVRLQETDGRAAKVKLTAVAPPKSARQVNFVGETLAELRVDGGAVWIDMSANEWAQVEVRW
jgi:alpha-mannosidase